MQIAVLASGTGSILEALIEDDLPIGLVVVDRRCRAEQVARAATVRTACVYRDDFSSSFDRDAYTDRVVDALSVAPFDLVAMAGFGTVLAKSIHLSYPNRILNTHPALLPSFKGWHAVSDALHAGVKVTGCTVHVASLEVDEGLILAQEAVEVKAEDSEQSLHERIKEVERHLYPRTIRRVLGMLENGEELS